MSTTFDSIHHSDVSKKQKRIYYRVQSPFPGINVWLTPAAELEGRRSNESATADTANTAHTGGLRFFKRVVGLGAKKTVTAAHGPRISEAPATNKTRVSPSDGSEATTQNTAHQLTDFENEYLEYVKKGIGRGEFTHYRLPVH